MRGLQVTKLFEDHTEFLAAFDLMGDAVILTDHLSRIHFANIAACSMLEYSQHEISHLSLKTLRPNAGLSRQRPAHRTEQPTRFEASYQAKSGKPLLFEVVSKPIVLYGQKFRLDVMRDVTARHNLEAELLRREVEFRSLAENSPDFVVRFDRTLQKVYTNPAYNNTINAKLKSSGKTDADSIWCPTNVTPAEFAVLLQRVMATGDTDNVLLEWVDDHGELVSHIVKVVAEYDASGEFCSCLAIGRNISEQRKAEIRLQQREQYMRTLLDNFPFMVWLKDANSRLLTANSAYATMAGVATTHELEGKTDFDFFPTELAQQYVDGDRQCMQTDTPSAIVCPIRDANGDYRWIESYKSSLRVAGEVIGTVGFARDITETLQREREYFSLIENSPNSIVRFDRLCKRIFINSRTAEYFNVNADYLLGKSPGEFPGGPSADDYEQAIRDVFEHGFNRSVDLKWLNGAGKQRCVHTLLTPEVDANGKVMAVIGVGQDVTETLEIQARIHHLAYFDSLTDLPNRALLTDRLNQAIADSSRHQYDFALMMLDLDRFKEINDTLGHAIGDALLCEAARRLERCLRSQDTVSRLGGDEFAVLLSEVRETHQVAQVAAKLLKAFEPAFHISGKEFFITASIGVVVYPSDSNSANDLLKFADSAMYHAKKQGRNNFQFYSSAMTADATERMGLQTALRKALHKGEFELFYQPQVDLYSHQIVGVEALLRWNKDFSEMVMPDRFISIAEESGLIVPIGEWVIAEACRMAVTWNQALSQPYTVAVNLSTRQFIQNDLVSSIQRILKESRCEPAWLKLEITESLLLEDNASIHKMLQALHDMGLSISIDDFGTGYSALSYLNRFPVSQLKIDRSFVQDITTNAERGLLVQAIISMASSMKKSLIAEGVETQEQADYLAHMGCPQAQGYLFGKPMRAGDLAQLLQQPAPDLPSSRET